MAKSNHKKATKFVILLGLVSLFADVASHGAKSITGAYLADLGASATIVGAIAGFGELIAYGLRLGSGYLADKTLKYWLITILGYGTNLLSIPLLALTGSWPVAASLIIAERTGKAMRTPARDAMLSYASNEIGMGWGFGLHQALDQFGAMLGPISISIIIFYLHSYRYGFALLFFPALIALIVLFVGKKIYPRPQTLEITKPTWQRQGITKVFWFYLVASALVAVGYVDFPLIAYHFEKTAILKSALIPLFYGVAMGTSALMALFLGKLYGHYRGHIVVLIAIIISSLFAPLVFLGGLKWAFLGMVLWGIGMGAQVSLIKAIIGDMILKDKRSFAYGLFNAIYGIAWFLGSVIMGILYDIAILGLVIFSVTTHFFAVFFFIYVRRVWR